MMSGLLAVFICALQASAQGTSAGVLAGVGEGSVLVRIDGHTSRFLVDKETAIWRGQDVNLTQLRLGDDLYIAYRISDSGDAVATQIWAGIDRWDGKVIRVNGESVEIARVGEHREGLGVATVVFDGRTVFNQGSRQDMKVGRELEVVGLVLDKHRMRASRVLHILE